MRVASREIQLTPTEIKETRRIFDLPKDNLERLAYFAPIHKAVELLQAVYDGKK